MNDDAFAALGLPARISVSDDDVRAAWRRIAAATHPDREDGGDPARFGAAAAAYAMLRTGYGRSEALAELGLAGDAPTRRRGASSGRHARRGPGPLAGRRALRGWAWKLAIRAITAGALSVAAILVAGWTPGTIGVLAGVLTWVAAAPVA